MDVIIFLQKQISQEAHPRQDYLELINLSLIMLGALGNMEANGVGDNGSSVESVQTHFSLELQAHIIGPVGWLKESIV
jgi:hypothetical protein